MRQRKDLNLDQPNQLRTRFPCSYDPGFQRLASNSLTTFLAMEKSNIFSKGGASFSPARSKRYSRDPLCWPSFTVPSSVVLGLIASYIRAAFCSLTFKIR